MSGEAASRTDPGLPGQQRALAEAAIECARQRGIPVIAIVFSGRPLLIGWLAEKVDALLAAWFLGSEAGNALADLLSGRISPSGRTPISWPRTIGQVPIFHAQRPSGRPADPKDKFTSKYIDAPNEPLYPFGYGLTYGRFVLSNLRVTPERVGESGTITARVDVRNEGSRKAEETVFLFTRDKLASVARPVLELQGFTKLTLAPGETATASITVAAAQLRFLGPDLTPVFEPGEIEILVGPCADRSQLLAATIVLTV
jgi:beta-glucosidase